jgi:hypothetical protein
MQQLHTVKEDVREGSCRLKENPRFLFDARMGLSGMDSSLVRGSTMEEVAVRFVLYMEELGRDKLARQCH